MLPRAFYERWLAVLAPADGVALPATQWPAGLVEELMGRVAASAVADGLVLALGPLPCCNLSQSWLRHGRPPHSWHQDGALGHDFMAHDGKPAPPEAALAMRTLWMTLTPCGVDAPGLQWVDAAWPTLLSPPELTEAAVSARFGTQAMRHATMAAGDALCFDGLLLHRTHLDAGMHRSRMSLELRFFNAQALPARLAGSTWQALQLR